MALPKGVRSPIDYTKLYMSNDLDGNSLNEKKGWRSELESIQERKIGKGKDEFFTDSTGKKKRMSQATRQDVGMAPKDPINVTPTGFRAKVDNAKNFFKQKVKLKG